MRRKEERSKQSPTNKQDKATQHMYTNTYIYMYMYTRTPPVIVKVYTVVCSHSRWRGRIVNENRSTSIIQHRECFRVGFQQLICNLAVLLWDLACGHTSGEGEHNVYEYAIIHRTDPSRMRGCAYTSQAIHE